MAARGIGSLLRGVVNAVFRPQQFVAFQTSSYASSTYSVVQQFGYLILVYVVNLSAYALPLTLAGVGLENAQAPPPYYTELVATLGLSPRASWQLLVSFIQNSLFITVATILTLGTFHVSVVLAGKSRGILQSIHTVVYTTSAYLAAVFSGVWYLSTANGVSTARQLVRNLQAEFVYSVVDFLGVGLGLPGGRPDVLVPGEISLEGQWVLAFLLIAVCYYLISLYYGARINHQTNRISGFLAVVMVTLSPIAYVAGSALITTFGVSQL